MGAKTAGIRRHAATARSPRNLSKNTDGEAVSGAMRILVLAPGATGTKRMTAGRRGEATTKRRHPSRGVRQLTRRCTQCGSTGSVCY